MSGSPRSIGALTRGDFDKGRRPLPIANRKIRLPRLHVLFWSGNDGKHSPRLQRSIDS